jgi:DNA-binding winged helix-turn-helix (wHTH) protein/predicted ATPase
MKPSRTADAPAVRIEAENERAWRGEQRLQLMPKAFAVLRHLVDHAGQLITKEELLTRVWRDAIVSDAALTTCIRDLRRALGDSSDTPRYIETVHRRGFRFIGPIAGQTPLLSARAEVGVERGASAATPTLVGRVAELARLHELLGKAMDRRRQLVFVTGEPGIGKTALVEAFLSGIGRMETLRIGRGQCVEQYGAGEAYLPVLEALGRLGRDPRGDRLVHVLKQHAPTWLAQLPALLTDADLEAVRRRAQGTTRERMLRELVEGLDIFTVDSPLVLVLEDLHWSDSATIDLLAMLARRREASRLLVIGTYRSADVAVTEHPLKATKHELELHGQCEEIPLEFLSVNAVTEYLSRRFAQPEWPSDLARALHRRTDGNPLFLVNTIDDLIVRGQLHEVDGRWVLAVPVQDLVLDAPETLSQMIQKQVERLTADEQAMLAVGCVAGSEFSAAVGTAGGIGAEEAERRCDALARRGQFLRAIGVAEWPDGTVAGRYAFIHSLYQHVLYVRLPFGQRARLHLRTGERLEQGYGQRAGEIAGELAAHFAEGRDIARAAQYHQQAAKVALRQHGYREAADHLTRALDFLKALPDSRQRTERELVLHELTVNAMLGAAFTVLTGRTGPEVERAYARARELCEQVDDPPRVFPLLLALGWFYFIRGSQGAARDVGARMLAIAEATGDRAFHLIGHHTMGVASFYGGEFETALGHLERGVELYDPQAHSPMRSPAFRHHLDTGVSCRLHGGWALWALGYPARAVEWMRAAMEVARSTDHPFSLAHCHRFMALFHQSRGERDQSREQAEQAVALATVHGFSAVLSSANFHRGRAMAEEGRAEDGLALMCTWVAACKEIRSECLLPADRAWLAETYGRVGRSQDGRDLVQEALAAATESGNHYWTADLYRVRGTLAESEKDAEASFGEAIAIARRQRAKSFELRAATHLSRLWARQGKTREAHALLAEAYAWFTEGFDTADLKDARALLEDLGDGRSGGGA